MIGLRLTVSPARNLGTSGPRSGGREEALGMQNNPDTGQPLAGPLYIVAVVPLPKPCRTFYPKSQSLASCPLGCSWVSSVSRNVETLSRKLGRVDPPSPIPLPPTGLVALVALLALATCSNSTQLCTTGTRVRGTCTQAATDCLTVLQGVFHGS